MKKISDIVYEEERDVWESYPLNSKNKDFVERRCLAYYEAMNDFYPGDVVDEDKSGMFYMYKVELDAGITIWTPDILKDSDIPF